MKLEDELQTFGLAENEVKIYLYLLQHGLKTPSAIAKGTGIARTNTYHVLDLLIDKGLISEQKEGKKKAYIPRDPDALMSTFEKRRTTLEQLLPELRTLHVSQKNKPGIRFFDGINEVREIYAATLKSDLVLALGSTKKIAEQDAALLDWYRKTLKENGIIMRDLLSYASGETHAQEWKNYMKNFYEYKVLPKKYADLPADLLVWGDTVALVSLAPPVFGTIITSPTISALWRTIFTIVWDSLPASAVSETNR